MIKVDQEFYSSPYYFFMRDKGNKYSLYFSVESTINEARKKDDVIHFDKRKGGDVKKYISNLAKTKKHKKKNEIKKDIEELVNIDGVMSNSKMPILDPKLHPKKTMDQTVAAASITNDPITRGYRTYYGESIEEVSEEDMSGAFGFEETQELDGKETFKYFKDELDMDEDEAKDRTEEQGKDWTGQKDKKSKFYGDPNFITRSTLSELRKQKVIKMVEDMLTKKKDNSFGDVNKKDVDVSPILKKNLRSIKKQADREGLSISELIKLIKGE